MKKKGRWFELEDMGGRIRLMSEEEVSSLPNEILKNMPLFCVQVEIPYAGHLHMKRDMT